jgi:hypothetical protein
VDGKETGHGRSIADRASATSCLCGRATRNEGRKEGGHAGLPGSKRGEGERKRRTTRGPWLGLLGLAERYGFVCFFNSVLIKNINKYIFKYLKSIIKQIIIIIITRILNIYL